MGRVSTGRFALVDDALREGGTTAAFDALASQLRDAKNYPQLFELRVMQTRRDLGLPLIQIEMPGTLPDETQRKLDAGFIAAAREVGAFFLADGDIIRAWPYFRAIGETAAVAEAIEKVEAGDGVDPVIEIAFQEGANPRKGFELILAQYGICRAITCYEQFPSPKGRDEAGRLLVRTLHAELVERLKRTIASNEEQAPETANVPELIAGRDWLFGEYAYYIDTSHLMSVLRFSLELDDRESLEKALEMTAYGQCLSSQFQYRTEPPFENTYIDHAAYLRALLGKDVGAQIAHFRAKVEQSDPEQEGTVAAQVLVGLLARIGRYEEAIAISLERLKSEPANRLACPPVTALCQMAGDFEALREISCDRGDPVSYLAAAVQSR